MLGIADAKWRAVLPLISDKFTSAPKSSWKTKIKHHPNDFGDKNVSFTPFLFEKPCFLNELWRIRELNH